MSILRIQQLQRKEENFQLEWHCIWTASVGTVLANHLLVLVDHSWWLLYGVHHDKQQFGLGSLLKFTNYTKFEEKKISSCD